MSKIDRKALFSQKMILYYIDNIFNLLLNQLANYEVICFKIWSALFRQKYSISHIERGS